MDEELPGPKGADSVQDISVLRLKKLADENRQLKDYVTDVMKQLRHNEHLFGRLFKLEEQVLASTDIEDLCYKLLRGLRSEFDLDMVRFWFARSSVVGQCELSTLSEADLVWIEGGEIERYQLNQRRVWLLQLASGDTFDWLESRDDFLHSLCLMVLGNLNNPIGVIALGSVETDRFSPDQSTDFLEHLAQVIGLTMENTLIRERLARIAMTDVLTGAHNRRFFQPHSHQALSQWFGHGTPVVCLYFDLDHLKNINDVCGRESGDQALADVSQTVRNSVRSSDPLVRMGGDEFVLLLPGCQPEKGKDIAEQIIRECAEMKVGEFELSLSMGLAVSTEEQDKVVKNLIDEADRAMYVAKALGGGRLDIADDHSAA